MNTILDQMLENYKIETLLDKKNAMKEVIQEIVLCGLSRADFFRKASFYGGTALRLFYGLDRFSEDLDFSLMEPDESFELNNYFPTLEKEINAYGLNMDISEKIKSGASNIQSAFLKGNTKEHLLKFYAEEEIFSTIAKNEVVRIKFEIDINPPAFALYERKYRLLPLPYEINLYDQSSLFAGKIHAILARGWKNRIKGRDLYDYVFYLSNDTPVNVPHLCARLAQTQHIADGNYCSLDIVKNMLIEKFRTINYEQARADVFPFIKNPSKVDLWSAEFFVQITEGLKEI